MKAMTDTVIASLQDRPITNKDICRHHFRPDFPEKLFSTLEIVFLLDGERFRYGFKHSGEEVASEWLYRQKQGQKEELLFARAEIVLEIGEDFKELKGCRKQINNYKLTLAIAAQAGGEISKRVAYGIGYGRFHFQGIPNTTLDTFTAALWEETDEEEKKENRREIVQFLRRFQLDFVDIQVESKNSSTGGGLQKADWEEIEKEISALLEMDPSLDPEQELSQLLEGSKGGYSDLWEPSVTFEHSYYDDYGKKEGYLTTELNLNTQESGGTIQLFEMAGPAISALGMGGTLIIDDLDARMHPAQAQILIDLFDDPKTNPSGAQLVYTTRNTQLLPTDHNRIWITEKNALERTDLYSLAYLEELRRTSWESDKSMGGKNFVRGQYGTIPFIGYQPQAAEEQHAL